MVTLAPALRRSVVSGAALPRLLRRRAPAAGQRRTRNRDPIAEFYKGKTVTILVGYEAGGGYDHLRAHRRPVPGQAHPRQSDRDRPEHARRRRPARRAQPCDRRRPRTAPRSACWRRRCRSTRCSATRPTSTPASFTWIGRAAMNVEVGVAFAKIRHHLDRGRAQARGADRRHRRHRELDGGAVPAQPARRHALQADRRLQERQRGAGHHGARRGRHGRRDRHRDHHGAACASG